MGRIFFVLFLLTSSLVVGAQEANLVQFPSELGLSHTWNRSLMKRVGQITARQERMQGQVKLPLPAFRYGDSPYLVAELGIETMKGLLAWCEVEHAGKESSYAVERIMKESGALEQNSNILSNTEPVKIDAKEYEENKAVALQAVRESIVLLKNENNALPLDASSCSKYSIVVSGKGAESISDAVRKRLQEVYKPATSGCMEVIPVSGNLKMAMGKTKKPVILVLLDENRPAVDRSLLSAAAIVEAWQPGTMGDEAITDVLTGKLNPGSRLTVPVKDDKGKVIYPSGHGLSYTTYAYSDLSLTPARITPDENVVVQFKVTNTGNCAGEVVALMHLQHVAASSKGDVVGNARLEGFKRTNLKPGETKDVKFTIRRRNIEEEGDRTVASGKWIVRVGDLTGYFEVLGE